MSNTPNRITEVTELVAAIALCGKQIDRIRFDSEETNATLAMCEIAVSFPPTWFTKEEILLVLAIVEVLHGDSKQFIDMIRSGHLSFYAKAAETALRESNRPVAPISQIVERAYMAHFAKFGAMC
jgi:hypothetical protein